MVTDPEHMFEKVRQESGEVEAFRTLVRRSKGLVFLFFGLVVLFVSGWFGMSIYAEGRINNCRDLVEDRFWSNVGDVIIQYRTYGNMSDELLDAMDEDIDRMRDITAADVCPSRFWPWDLPSEPSLPPVPDEIPEPAFPPPSTTRP